ncbi:MAG: hypothetical protein JSR27_05020 [Proteobacteria bacterium]|nr:hypothetical protein [Pseudomonadota bacterium]
MPSSISSSDPVSVRRWLAAWLVAIVLAVATCASVEAYWRAHGFRSNVLDSRQLWSQQRMRVDRGHGIALALLGASRTEYGIDPQRLRERLPAYRPVMLAVNAHYPLATLRDLAADTDFRGVVLCDLDAVGYLRAYWDMQQSYVDYYHTQWTPSWNFHRMLLTDWQRAAVIANPEFGWKASLLRAFTGAAPFRDYVRYRANRSGDIDYREVDVAASKRHFAETMEGNIAHLPPHDPQRWLADLAPMHAWIAAINARGGSVIFYQSPLSGLQREAMQRVFPPAEYWDRLIAAFPEAHFLDADDVPELAAFRLPDDSHMDYRDKAAYTDALARVLVERGFVRR